MEYSEKLRDPRWQKKRLEIMERDGFECQSCYSKKKELQIHHRYYLSGKEPWEHSSEALVTLCKDCHAWEREQREELENDLLEIIRAAGFLCGDLYALNGRLLWMINNKISDIPGMFYYLSRSPIVIKNAMKDFAGYKKKEPGTFGKRFFPMPRTK